VIVEIGKAFTFVTSEDDWIKKIAIGAVLVFINFIPIIPMMLLFGYQIRVAQNVIRGDEHPLPEWEDWGQLFIDGAIVWVAGFLYALPAILVTLCASLVIVFGAGGFDGNDESTAAIGGGIILACLAIFFILALLVIMPALFIQYARTGEFGPLFSISQVLGIARDNIGDIILTMVAFIVASLLLAVVSILLSVTICGGIIAWSAGSAWLYISLGHMFGQIGAKHEAKLNDAAYSV
jgi:hypothetical protein